MKRKLAENLKRVRRRIAEACARAGRDPHAVTLVVVTKYAPAAAIPALLELGVKDFGESRPQALIQRASDVAAAVRDERGDASAPVEAMPRWHLVGHLQRNKVKALLPYVDLIHSVDTLRLAEEIDAQSSRLSRITPILLEVNTADDPSKNGCAVAAATHLAEQIATLRHIDIRGLMAMAPLTDNVAIIRQVFERTRELFDEIVSLRSAGPSMTALSMGMSSDFECAIEFGATHVRIGSAVFEGIEPASEPVHSDESS